MVSLICCLQLGDFIMFCNDCLTEQLTYFITEANTMLTTLCGLGPNAGLQDSSVFQLIKIWQYY